MIESQLNARLMVDEEVINYDTHKIDYLKGRVALDMEWNSKDQTFDRDLYAFRVFFDYNKINLGVLLTRSKELNPLFQKLGRDVWKKYGASTTHMGKLLTRLDSGRNGGCPVLVFGITPRIVDLKTVTPLTEEDIEAAVDIEDDNTLDESIDTQDLKKITLPDNVVDQPGIDDIPDTRKEKRKKKK